MTAGQLSRTRHLRALRQAKAATGLCTYNYCQEPATPNRAKCQKHGQTKAAKRS